MGSRPPTQPRRRADDRGRLTKAWPDAAPASKTSSGHHSQSYSRASHESGAGKIAGRVTEVELKRAATGKVKRQPKRQLKQTNPDATMGSVGSTFRKMKTRRTTRNAMQNPPEASRD